MKAISELRSEPILLAHHPLCGRFDDHLMKFRGRSLCRGCFTVYPSATLFLAALWLLELPFSTYLITALALFGLQLPRFVRSLHSMAIPFNVVLGASLASVIMAMVTCPAEMRLFLYPFVVAVAGSFMYLKGRRVLATCRGCPNYSAFPHCAKGYRSQNVDREQGVNSR